MSKQYSDAYVDFNEIRNVDLRKIIEKNGFAVIENVLTEDRSDHYVDQIWEWLADLTDSSGKRSGIVRNNPESWVTEDRAKKEGLDSYNWPNSGHGILTEHGISHADFVWEARTERNVKSVFKKIWKTNELLVSFDGVCTMLPQKYSHVEEPDKSWFHFDQSPIKKGLHYVQGFLNLQDTTEKDGCLMVYPKSNNYHAKFFEDNKASYDFDWYKFNDTNKGNEWMLNQGLKPVKVVAPKGSLVLWDSRTAHCSSPPVSDSIRHCIYICMVPKDRATDKDLVEKQSIFHQRLGTNHSPVRGIITTDESMLLQNNESPRPPKYQDQSISNQDVTLDILALSGFDTGVNDTMMKDLSEMKRMYEFLGTTVPYESYYADLFREKDQEFQDFYNNAMSDRSRLIGNWQKIRADLSKFRNSYQLFESYRSGIVLLDN